MFIVIFHGLIGEPNNPIVDIDEDTIGKKNNDNVKDSQLPAINSNTLKNQDVSTHVGRTDKLVCPHKYLC